jgi:hypothetical protein
MTWNWNTVGAEYISMSYQKWWVWNQLLQHANGGSYSMCFNASHRLSGTWSLYCKLLLCSPKGKSYRIVHLYTSHPFANFRLNETHKLIPLFKFARHHPFIRAPSSRKSIVHACCRTLCLSFAIWRCWSRSPQLTHSRIYLLALNKFLRWIQIYNKDVT